MFSSDLSLAAHQGGWELPTYKICVVSTCRRVQTNRVSGRTLQPYIVSVIANSFVPSDFLVDGQVSGLGTVHPLLPLTSLAHGFFFFMLCFFPLILCTKPFGDGAMVDGGRLLMELAASSSCSARRRPC